MKKIFTLLFAVLFSVQFAAAQQTLYVYSKSGNLAAYTVNKVIFDNDIFVFTYGSVTEITKESFSTSFSVEFKSTDYKSFSQTPEIGICFSGVNENPTIADGKIKKGTSLSEYSFSINGLDAGTTYYYRAYVKVNDAVYYGDVKSETTFGEKPTYSYINGHKFVDLGLPSGLLWAETNIGAEESTDHGCHFAWGETDTSEKSSWDWNNYKFGTQLDLTKYNSSDGKTTLDKEDDAAYVNWGDSCRMPTNDEFAELLDSANCTWIWTSKTASNGSSTEGYKVTSVKNGNSIFLPASGLGEDGIPDAYSCGYYWSNTISWILKETACCLDFSSGSVLPNFGSRCYGRTVRPVAEP